MIPCIQSDFEEKVLKATQPALVEFSAGWCTQCKIIKPHVLDLEKEFPSVKFLNIDADEDSYLAEKYEVFGLPTFILFENGKEKKRLSGAITKNTLKKFIED